jgi:glutathione synthase/RimK-type ligase-like ATP-grasp enzyme
MPISIRIATCTELPEPDPDSEPLQKALRSANVSFQWLAWDDPNADWTSPVPTLLRTTWNYVHAPNAFSAWLAAVAKVAPLFNPLHIVNGNIHKRYLLGLAAQGVAVAPTTLVAKTTYLPDPFVATGTDKIVIKPAIGAGSAGTKCFHRVQMELAVAHLQQLTAIGDALVQPYIASVDDYGERSLVWIDGEISHAIRKHPRFAGQAEFITGPHDIADDERALATKVMAPLASDVLYARIDMARDSQGQPMVMELEMIEPSLFFARHPLSADRFVDGLMQRLSSSPR